MIRTLLYVGAGSFMGGSIRYLLIRSLSKTSISTFPLGTMAVNLGGCFLAGLVLGYLERNNMLNPNLSMFLMVGFCGGFTTFSSFIHDGFQMMKRGDFIQTSIYASASLLFGLLLFYLGNKLVANA